MIPELSQKYSSQICPFRRYIALNVRHLFAQQFLEVWGELVKCLSSLAVFLYLTFTCNIQRKQVRAIFCSSLKVAFSRWMFICWPAGGSETVHWHCSNARTKTVTFYVLSFQLHVFMISECFTRKVGLTAMDRTLLVLLYWAWACHLFGQHWSPAITVNLIFKNCNMGYCDTVLVLQLHGTAKFYLI